MNTKFTPNKIRMILVIALSLFVLAFSKETFLFAAAPTVTTGSASSITKTTGDLAATINNNGGQIVTSVGFDYGTTSSYGSTQSGILDYGYDSDVGSPGDFVNPYDVAIDSSGNIYVLDSGNNRVKKFNSSGVFQSQFGTAGSGDGQFNAAVGIAIDSSDNIYVVDTTNNRIQKFNSSGVFQSKFGTAGSGNGQFDQPYQMDFDSLGNIYVVENGNMRVQKFNSSGVYQSQFGVPGFSDGEFNAPSGIGIDSSDNIYVVDRGNNRVEKFDSAGVYQSQFGVGDLSSPFSLDFDSLGNIYITNGGSLSIKKFDSSGVYISDFAMDSSSPVGLAVDSSDNIYLTDTSTNQVRKFTFSSITASLSGLSCGTTYHFAGFATNSDGTSYGNDTTFTTLSCETPVVETNVPTSITKTSVFLHGLESSDGGSSSTVRGFQYGTTTAYGNTVNISPPATDFAESIGQLVSFDVHNPSAIALDITGNIYVALKNGAASIKNTDSGAEPFLGFGWGIATGGDQFETCDFFIITCGDGIPGNNLSNNGQFDEVEGLTVDNSGNIYVADTGNNRIQVFDSSGNFLYKFGTLGTGNDNLDTPKGLVVKGTNLYVVDSGNNRIKKLNLDGTYVGEVGSLGSGPGQFNSPSYIALAPDGTLYVSDTGNNRIQYINSNTLAAGVVTFTSPVGWTNISGPTGIYVNDKNDLIISDTGNNRIVYAAQDVGPSSFVNISYYGSLGSGEGQFDSPKSLFQTNSGFIYVADENNNSVRSLSPFMYKKIKPLVCGTTYHYRAFATNSDGTSYGNDVSFTTSSCGSTGGGGGPLPILGCTDPAADNYNVNANQDDGSCSYPSGYFGCTDPAANNYSATAVADDGSCDYSVTILGCTDPLATNFDSTATQDDGSCIIPSGGGGGGEPPAPVLGCTDSTATNFNPAATQDNGSCLFSQIPPNEPPIIPVISNIPGIISGFVTGHKDIVDRVVRIAAPVGLVAPGLLYLLLQDAPLVSIPIRLWNLIPTLLGFRRRRRPWGTVYDSITKQPLDPAYVTLKNISGGGIATSITDIDGRYSFVADPGDYTLDAKKTDYIFPSVKMSGKDRDELYDNLYFGGTVSIEEEDEIINKNIPMDAVNFNWNEFEKARNKKLMKFFSRTELFLSRIAKVIFIAGLIASIILVYIDPSVLNLVILGIYLVILILSFFGIKPIKPGFVFERENGFPLSFAIITVFSAALNREVSHAVVGKTGRYHVLVPRGNYFIKLKKKTGEDSYEEVYTSPTFKAKKGYINKIIKI